MWVDSVSFLCAGNEALSAQPRRLTKPGQVWEGGVSEEEDLE